MKDSPLMLAEKFARVNIGFSGDEAMDMVFLLLARYSSLAHRLWFK